MENNNTTIRPASEMQINYLRRLGYTGDAEGLTNAEASALIQQYNQKKAQAQNQQTPPQPTQSCSSYEQPNYQQTYSQPQNPYPTQKNSYNPPAQVIDCSITTRQGETFSLDKKTVDDYVCKGMSDGEYKYFFSVCKHLGLNPFLRDIYAIKFGNSPAQFIIDYKVLQQSADENPKFNGMKTGVLVENNGTVSEHEGAFLLPNERLIGAWCEVYRKDRDFPTKAYAMFNEVCKFKEGQPSGTWKEKPVFMNVKVAKAWALREAFPNMFSNNTYTSDEIDVIENTPSNESVSQKQRSYTASSVPPTGEEEFNI